MQAEIVQWEKSVKAECIFYVNVIRRHEGVSLSERSNWLDFIRQRRKEFNDGIPKKVAAQLSGCSRGSRITVPLPFWPAVIEKIYILN